MKSYNKLPENRTSNQVYIVYVDEPPPITEKYFPSSPIPKNFFNWSITYMRNHSDIYTPYFRKEKLQMASHGKIKFHHGVTFKGTKFNFLAFKGKTLEANRKLEGHTQWLYMYEITKYNMAYAC